jgi:hypothetical protein
MLHCSQITVAPGAADIGPRSHLRSFTSFVVDVFGSPKGRAVFGLEQQNTDFADSNVINTESR